ncbi:MAG: hypothetical protein ABIH92_04455 [Nanoarchaeota archaeon]
MVKIINFDGNHYFPPKFNGLVELVRFPDGEFKRNTLPNSTVWVFEREDHRFNQEILADDVGCGMAAFSIGPVDPRGSADRILSHLKGKRILGRGNHFVDIGEVVNSPDLAAGKQILFLHTDGKSYDANVPTSLNEVRGKQRNAEEFREHLGYQLAGLIETNAKLIGNWTHNSVEETDQGIVYRKGVVKLSPGQMCMLPAHLGEEILMYELNKNNLPPHSSMPHATGRQGPRGKTKVTPEEASTLRESVYIPQKISDQSLRTEHPSCYNGFEKIFDKLGPNFSVRGKARILSYVGKV